MEIAFHSNKCALKDSLRLIKIGKNPCWKKRYQLFKYASGLISANESIISLKSDISEYNMQEFNELIAQYTAHANIFISRKGECVVCLKNCLEDLQNPEAALFLDEEIITTRSSPEMEMTDEKIAQVADKMKRLNTKTEFMESIINMQTEDLDRVSYSSTSVVDYSESHLSQLEEALRKKKRAVIIKRWLGGVVVFFCFLSLLLLRPFII
ncbi:hypothetical protein NEAUS03_2077 [Nematocida ausubeli]|nr:hypothetical protein NEAUS03_2077 [Nematocida ausubeli]